MNIRLLLCAGLLGTTTLWSGCRQLGDEKLAHDFAASRIFGNHMVMQRNVPISIFGNAEPGGSLDVKFDGETLRVKAGSDGQWQALFPAREAGGPYSLTLRGAERTVHYSDILVGDVWFCSGQSNMAQIVGHSKNADREIASANHPNIRILQVITDRTSFPLTDLIRVRPWQPVRPDTIRLFSATGYYFGRELQAKLNVPIGLIQSAWGGTPIEMWLPVPGTNMGDAEKILCQKYVADIRRAITRLYDLERPVNHPELVRRASPDADIADMKPVQIPCRWEKTILPDFDGMVEFRLELNLPADWAGRELELELGAIDEVDRTYFNGVEIARRGNSETSETGYWRRARYYRVPADKVKAGRNVLTVFVSDLLADAGMWGQQPMRINPFGAPAEAISLEGEWLYRVVVEIPKTPPFGNSKESCAYNAMVAPFFRFPIKGAIWYQGESNASRATQYRKQLPAMIADWRTNWGIDFPFYIVQLANYTNKRVADPVSHWAQLRESQRLTAETFPNTGLAVIIDIGEAADIHPKNKQDVGRRLALQALAKTYGFREIVFEGPAFEKAEFTGNKATVRFRTNKSPIRAEKEFLGFELAGKDKRYFPAQAVLENGALVVTSEKVPAPQFVRYAWAENPVCNLFNEAGLPASPFTSEIIFR